MLFFVIGKNMSEIDIITSKQFETLFKEMHTQLFYLAYDILGEAQAAQDVVSDVSCRYGINIVIFHPTK